MNLVALVTEHKYFVCQDFFSFLKTFFSSSLWLRKKKKEKMEKYTAKKL